MGGSGTNPVIFGDLWLFSNNANSWSLMNQTGGGPGPRFGHTAVSPLDTMMVIFGGSDFDSSGNQS